MKKTFIPIFLFFLSINVFAQLDYSFSGYVVDMPIYSINNSELSKLLTFDQKQFFNLSRVRLRPEFYLWKDARVNIEYELDGLYSPKKSFFVFNNISTNRQIVDLKWNLLTSDNYTITHYIDRLYLRQGFSWGNIIIGRQRIAWGTGRIWNPTDLFNPINPSNFSKIEKDGADAVSLTYYMGNFTDLNVVYNPQTKIKNSNAAFRFRTNFNEFDVAVVGGYVDNRIVAGGDFAGNFFDAGIRGEGIVSMNKDNMSDNYTKLIFGMDNQFTSKLYGLFEYHYNGQGAIDKNNYDLFGLLDGKLLNLSRNYLFVSASYLVTPLLNVTISSNKNLNDASGFIGLTGVYSLSDNASITLGGQFNYGPEFSEYWYYPTSLYLQAQLFF